MEADAMQEDSMQEDAMLEDLSPYHLPLIFTLNIQPLIILLSSSPPQFPPSQHAHLNFHLLIMS